jgi:hypothetical protein
MNIFSGKRCFNDILWAPAYNNNTLPDTGIRSNKIEIQGAQLWKGKRKMSHIFFNWPYPMYFVTKKLGIEGEFSNAQMIIYLRRH